MKLRFRAYDTDQGLLVAVCDEDLVGRTFRDGEVRLEVSEDFYGDDNAAREEVVEGLRDAAIANLVGEGAVEAGVEAEVVDTENVLYVDGVPHAQMVRM